MGLPLLHILSENSAGECGIKTADIINTASRMKAGAVAVADYARLDAFHEMRSRADEAGVKMLCAVSVDYMVHGCDLTKPGTETECACSENVFRIVLIAKDETGYGQMCGILSDSAVFDKKGNLSCVADAEIFRRNVPEAGHMFCLSGGIDGISRLFAADGRHDTGTDTETGPVRSMRDVNSDISDGREHISSLEREIGEISMKIALADENGTDACGEKEALKKKKKELTLARKHLSALREEKKRLTGKQSAADTENNAEPSSADTAVEELKSIFGRDLFLELSPDILSCARKITGLSGKHGVPCAVSADAVTLSGTEEELKRLSVVRQGTGCADTVIRGNEDKRRPYTEDEIRGAFPGIDTSVIDRTVLNAGLITSECGENVFPEDTRVYSGINVPRLMEKLADHVRGCERDLYGVSMEDLLYVFRKGAPEGVPRSDNGVNAFRIRSAEKADGGCEIRVRTTRRAFENAVLRLSEEGYPTSFIMENEKTDIRGAFKVAGGILSGTGGRARRETAELSEKISTYLDGTEDADRTVKSTLNEIRAVFGRTPAYDRIAETVKVLAGLPTGRYIHSGKAFVFENSPDNEPVQTSVLCRAEGVRSRVLFTGITALNGVTVVLETDPYTEILMMCAGSIRGNTDFTEMFLQGEKKSVLDGIYSGGNTLFTAGADTEKTVRAWEGISPQSVEEVAAGIVLSHAAGNMPLYSYVKRKNEKEYVNYRFDSLRDITGPTFGRFLYEDQITDGICATAGYGTERAVNILSVMRNGSRRVSDSEREDFIRACVRNAASAPGAYSGDTHTAAEDARAVFNDMRRASAYVRDRDEVLYEASLSYACAYMKLRHPSEYMAAVLSVTEWREHASVYAECGRMGLKVLLPDINRAYEKPVVTSDGDILCGFGCIRGFDADADEIVLERKNGVYKGMVDFIKRTGTDERNTALLIKAGAFDFETGDRTSMIREAVSVQSAVQSRLKTAEKLRLLETAEGDERTELEIRSARRKLAELDERLSSVMLPKCGADPNVKSALEKEVLGAVVGPHPLDGCAEAVPGAESTDEVRRGKRITLAGIVRETEVFRTASENREMARFFLEDKNGTASVMVFPECFEKHGACISDGAVVRVSGMCMEDRADPGNTVVAASEVSKISGLMKPVVIDAGMPGWEEALKKHASAYGHPVILLRGGRLEVVPILVDGGILEEDRGFIRECYTVFPL